MTCMFLVLPLKRHGGKAEIVMKRTLSFFPLSDFIQAWSAKRCGPGDDDADDTKSTAGTHSETNNTAGSITVD